MLEGIRQKRFLNYEGIESVTTTLCKRGDHLCKYYKLLVLHCIMLVMSYLNNALCQISKNTIGWNGVRLVLSLIFCCSDIFYETMCLENLIYTKLTFFFIIFSLIAIVIFIHVVTYSYIFL